MNKNLTNFMFFVAGAAVGALSAWKLAKTKYEKIANEEIESVKEVFLNKVKGKDDEEHEEIDIRKNNAKEYKTLVQDLPYSVDNKDDEEDEDDMKDIYVISPADFGENDFDTESLTYYADGVLTDEVDEVIDNVDDVVGSDSLNHFGEYEDDSVFVRNERLGIDYEILLDVRKYHDIYKNE